MTYNCYMKNKVVFEISKKELKKLPSYILQKLLRWAEQVEKLGIIEVRKAKGWNDEALKGNRAGQRSIRLNKAYRAIYKIEDSNIIVVLEANKHEY
jgi:proteic killer suppression protein